MANDHDDTAELPIHGAPETREPAGASARVALDVAALSHQGKVRKNNEDHFIVTRFDRTMRTLLSNLPEGDVPERYAETVYGMLVADGVGGAVGGEVASRTAITAIMDLVIDTPDWIMRLDEPLAQEVLKRMEDRFQKVREVLVDLAKKDPTLGGMATTMTLACSLGPELLIAHVGDSRAYAVQGGELHRLTRDQTMAQSLADAGAITPDEVGKHPARHILTGALATRGAFAHVQLRHSRLDDGDQILLCSDGLTEMVPEEAIAGVLRAPGPSADACRALVDLALEAGGKDNVTVVLGRYKIPK
jgi:serine/threonine protein phosphatase PrpC